MRKLVRHKIPQLMTVDAGVFVEPNAGDRGDYLRTKLFEEVGEYLSGHDPEELVDIMETCYALSEDHGWSDAVLADVARMKTQVRGHLRRPGVLWIVGETA